MIENPLVERMCLAACITTEDAVAILEALKNPPESMVTAYLSANSAYWKEVDDGPSHPSKWRNGTPAEAVSVGWNAMIDVVLQSHRGEKS